MKTLYLLRHAQAESPHTGYADFDRPLTLRGQEEADAVKTYLQTKGITFDFIMCSAALRTRETMESVRSVVGTEEINVSEEFYNISEDKILNHVNDLSDEKGKVLYIGHNPGIAFSILRLAQAFPDFLNEGVQPATLVGFEFPCEGWKDLAWKTGKIIDIFQPKLVPAESLAPEGS